MRFARWASTAVGVAGASYATYVATTWLRYGRARRSVDGLLDRFMPSYEVMEAHAIDVAAPAEVTLAAARDLDPEESRIVFAIFRARELFLRGKRDETVRPRGLFEGMKAIGWGVLAATPEEIVMGAVTRPWEANPVFRPLAPEAFAGFCEPGYVKIAWTLRAVPTGDGASRFSTETRVIATDPGSRRRFRRYWSFLSPGVLIIRRAILLMVKAAAERRAKPLPGDDIIADARAQLTHEIIIDARPRDVWPWLVQMGRDRAGWYSWDILDNGGKRSADHIIPELQHLSVGDVLPYGKTGPEGFKVLRIEPDRLLVLGADTPAFEGTWAFVLEPIGDGGTRLVTRYRATYPPSLKMSMFLVWMSGLHAFMERKQLRTIKHHAEQRARA
jgi:hypothetical protein